MQLTGGEFDVIVIGSGHSGRETALAATREGCSTLLISLSPGTIASMMWSTSDESPLKQELIQAFIPSGYKNKNNTKPTATIQTTLHQPERESSVYVLQAQVQQNRKKLPGSNATVLHSRESKPTSSGQSSSLREREKQIREKLLRRNNRPQKPEDQEDSAAAVKPRPGAAIQKPASSVYRQRNNDLRKKLLDRNNGREKQLPPQPRRKEVKEAPKRDFDNASKAASPILFPTSRNAKGLSESLIHKDRPRRKKQHTDGTAKVRPLIYHKSSVQERKPANNRFQSLVWEDSEGSKSTRSRKESEVKRPPEAEKIKYANTGTKKLESMEEGKLQARPPDSAHVQKNQHNRVAVNEHPTETIRQKNKLTASASEQEKKKISFIEREQARMILEQSSNSPLKREAVRLEDPYGYNAWEDIMPFSKGKENSAALDASEKRKIALRGLRNLINNLG